MIAEDWKTDEFKENVIDGKVLVVCPGCFSWKNFLEVDNVDELRT